MRARAWRAFSYGGYRGHSVPELLQVRGLTKRFGGLTATDVLNLEVRVGELHALIGPNGAGKTTLIHQLSGALRPDGGAIVFDGIEVTRRSQHERVHLGLARSYQITSVFRGRSVLDNLLLAVLARSGSSLRFWRPVACERALYDEAAAMADRVGLSERLHHAAGALAHGEQRQLEVGLTLATRAKLLLLDEPMAGMGPEESALMIALLAGLKGSVTMLLVEHDMDAVFRLADRISVLASGRIIATGVPDEIRRNAEVRRAYLGDELAA
jgi:branched-chain amino acid transport system ATP-binding protein